MKIIEWIFRVILALSIILGAIIAFTPGSNEGMAGLSSAVGLGILFAVGGFSLMVLVVTGIVDYFKKSKISNANEPSQQKKNVTKIILLLIAFAVLAVIFVPMIVWTVGIFTPQCVTRTVPHVPIKCP